MTASIVFIHGANTNSGFWDPSAKILREQKGYNVHCLDLPGFGTHFLENPENIDAIVDFIYHYISQTFVGKKPVLIGHSAGAYFASKCVSKYGQNVCSHFILVNATGLFSIFGNDTWFWGFLFHYRLIGPLVTWLYGEKKQKDVVENIGDVIISRMLYFDALRNQFGWKNPCLSELVKLDSPPISIIWGERDPIVPKRVPELIAQFMDSRHAIIYLKSCGHNPPTENPILFAEAVHECLAIGGAKFTRLPTDTAKFKELTRTMATFSLAETEMRWKTISAEIVNLILN